MDEGTDFISTKRTWFVGLKTQKPASKTSFRLTRKILFELNERKKLKTSDFECDNAKFSCHLGRNKDNIFNIVMP